MSSDLDSNDGFDRPTILRCPNCSFHTYDDPHILRQHMQDSHNVDANAGGAGQSGQNVSTAEASTHCDISPEDGSSSSSSALLSKCPICHEEFTRATSVRRHMTRIHSLSGVQVSKYPIKVAKHCCPHCGNQYTNLSKHYQHCKKKNTSKQVTTAAASEGSSIVPAFKTWLQTKTLATKYMKSLVAKLKRIISCWEETIPNFKGDNLLDPIKKNLSPITSSLSPLYHIPR